MATIHLDPASSPSEPPGAPRRAIVPAIRWGAVLAGVVVCISIQLVLTLLGIATGLSATNLARGETPGTGPLVWAGISMLVAAFLGGYVAARMTGLKRKADGVLHGVVTWAVTTLLFAWLATSSGGALLSGVFASMNSASVEALAGPDAEQGGLAAMLVSRLGKDAAPEDLRMLQTYIERGERDRAIQHMAARMGVETDRASTIVDQALILAGAPERASPEARAAADRAADAAGNAAWVVFLTAAFSLALGIGGGALGAVSARRTTWAAKGDATEAALTGESAVGRRSGSV